MNKIYNLILLACIHCSIECTNFPTLDTYFKKQNTYLHNEEITISINPSILINITNQEKVAVLKRNLTRLLYTQEELSFYNRKTLPQLVELLQKSNNNKKAQKTLDHILRKIYKTTQTIEKNTSLGSIAKLWQNTLAFLGFQTKKNKVTQLKIISSHIILCASELYPRLSLSLKNPERIYYTNLLKTLLFQPQKESCYSYKSILADKSIHPCSHNETTCEKQNSKNFSYLYNIEKQTQSEEVKAGWKCFIQGICNLNSPIITSSLLNLTNVLEKLLLTPHWLKTSFFKYWHQTNKNSKRTALFLTQEYAGQKDLLEEIIYKKQRLFLIKKTNWKNKSQTKKNWKKLKKHIIPFFSFSEVSKGKKEKGLPKGFYDFKQVFLTTNYLGKIAIINALKNTIQCFELFIYKQNHIPKEIIAKQYNILLKNLNPLLSKDQINILRNKKTAIAHNKIKKITNLLIQNYKIPIHA